MQYPVPQFTDIEDRLVAGLSIKQFGILLFAGIMTFAIFTISNNIVLTVVFGIFFGLPSVALAFGRLNGRPLYSSLFAFFGYFTNQSIFIFRKEAKNIRDDSTQKIKNNTKKTAIDERTVKVRIHELNYQLQQQASEEAELIAHR